MVRDDEGDPVYQNPTEMGIPVGVIYGHVSVGVGSVSVHPSTVF